LTEVPAETEPAGTADLPTSTALERAVFDLIIYRLRQWRPCHALPRAASAKEQTMNTADRRAGDASLRISRNGQIRYFVPPYDAFQENPARCR
jgi:hypothetical protein